MEEKTQMLASMSLTFGGQNSIEADVLMTSLDSALKAYKATLSAEYDGKGADITLNIRAFAPGSVEVLLESVVGMFPLIAPQVPTVIESTKHFLEIIKLKKELRGKKPISVENEGDKVKITNQDGDIHYHDSTVYNFYINNPTIDAGLTRMFGALAESQRPLVSFSTTSDKVEIEKAAYPEMRVAIVDNLKEIESKKIESVVDEQLLLKSPDLLGRSKWEFYYDGKIISASIEDENFNESVRKGEVKLYAGIKIPVRMRIEAYFNEKLEPERRVFTILEVLGALIDPSEEDRQLLLEEFKEE